MINGLVLVNKPRGLTSHDIVLKIRRLFQQQQVGHSGTLDPMATGLIIILLGKATRLFSWISKNNKVYQAQVCFGVATDTLDADGQVTKVENVKLTREEIEEVCLKFKGEMIQKVPSYSAIRIKGQRLYNLTRQGIEVKLPERKVTVYDCKLLNFKRIPKSRVLVDLRLSCSSGTFVRSLAAELGYLLDCPAHLASLARLEVGNFTISQATTLESLLAAKNDGRLAKLVIDCANAFPNHPKLILKDRGITALKNGQLITKELLGRRIELIGNYGDEVVFVGERGNFLGLGKIKTPISKNKDSKANEAWVVNPILVFS